MIHDINKKLCLSQFIGNLITPHIKVIQVKWNKKNFVRLI